MSLPSRSNVRRPTARLPGMLAPGSRPELLEMGDTEVAVTIACVSNQAGGDLIGNARWLGVPWFGRWTAGYPLAVLDGRPALVAVGMNGEPRPVSHGFRRGWSSPASTAGVSDTEWLSEIELTTFDAYWVRRGWTRDGPVMT